VKITIINEENAVLSKWAGGESRQYYIYPPDSSYAERNFMFRVSVASSDTEEESPYSDLRNYTRYLMILEGTAHVYHNERYDIVLNPYDKIDIFDGGWESSATGRMTDFNLMVRKECSGEMSVIDKNCTYEAERGIHMFFCGRGSAAFEFADEKISICTGELFVLENAGCSLNINVGQDGDKLIMMYVYC